MRTKQWGAMRNEAPQNKVDRLSPNVLEVITEWARDLARIHVEVTEDRILNLLWGKQEVGKQEVGSVEPHPTSCAKSRNTIWVIHNPHTNLHIFLLLFS